VNLFDKGLIIRPNISKGLEYHIDADFSGGFSTEHSDDAAICLSQAVGDIIWFAGCPLIWSSKLQITISLSTTTTTKAKYIALSSALHMT
jgi:hypothetical protein